MGPGDPREAAQRPLFRAPAETIALTPRTIPFTLPRTMVFGSPAALLTSSPAVSAGSVGSVVTPVVVSGLVLPLGRLLLIALGCGPPN